MSNILKSAQNSNYLETLRDLLICKGCNVDENADMDDIADIIDGQMCHCGDPVVNAILVGGPGIKVTPFDRKGYKISASDEALLSGDISNDLPQGTTIHKALFDIVNKQIPRAMRRAAGAPAIVGAEVFRAEPDGCDYYDNKAFPRHGQGRKSGLRPYAWYLKIYLFSQAEPLYVELSALVEGIRIEFLKQARQQTQRMIEQAMFDHMRRYHSAFDGECPCGCPYEPDPEPEPEPEPDPDPDPIPGCGCSDDCGCDCGDDCGNMTNIDDYLNNYFNQNGNDNGNNNG